MTPCPRPGCGGTVGVFAWHDTCSLCARGLITSRPPTAEEKWSRGRGVVTETNYLTGIYAVDYVPTPEDRRRAAW